MARTYDITTDDLCVNYEKTQESIDHAFGMTKQTRYEITRIEAYVPALETWLDVTHMNEFLDASLKLINKEESGDINE